MSGIPSAAWLQALDRLLQLAGHEAELRRFPIVIERSDCSEARYIHVCRKNTWYGVRIAAHLPFYSCSRDYFQILLEEPAAGAMVDYSCRQMRALIAFGGSVIACPRETQAEINRVTLDNVDDRASRQQIATLRHQLNQRAKWLAELYKQEDLLS